MKDKRWAVTYIRDGNQESLEIEWPERPTNEQAAQRIWKREFPGPEVIPSVERDDPNPTVTQLRQKKIEIVAIDEVED